MSLVTGRVARSSQASHAVWILLIVGGVLAATHIWKLAGALPWLRDEIPMSLVLAGFLLAIIQVASIVGGLPAAWIAQRFGVKRLAIIGLLLMAAGSLLGATSHSYSELFAYRTVEGVGFLLYVVLAPALISLHAPEERKSFAVGAWATFHGVAALIGMSGTVAVLSVTSWRVWWLTLGAITLFFAFTLMVTVPGERQQVGTWTGSTPPQSVTPQPAQQTAHRRGRALLRSALVSLRDRNTLIAGLAYACYSAPWLAVLGFLPTVLEEGSGISSGMLGLLSGIVGVANAAGALIGARLLHTHANGSRVLTVCFLGMGATASLAFLIPLPQSAQAAWITAWLLLFSAFGGVIPAFLTRLAITITPHETTPQATLGLMQQIFNVGNLAAPPLLAWMVVVLGGWQGAPLLVFAFIATGIVSVFFLRSRLS